MKQQIQEKIFSYCGELSRVMNQFLQNSIRQSCNLIASFLPFATTHSAKEFVSQYKYFSSKFTSSFYSSLIQSLFFDSFQPDTRANGKDKQNQIKKDRGINQFFNFLLKKCSTQLNIVKMIDDFFDKTFQNATDKKYSLLEHTVSMLQLIEESVSNIIIPYLTINKKVQNPICEQSQEFQSIQNLQRLKQSLNMNELIDLNNLNKSQNIKIKQMVRTQYYEFIQNPIHNNDDKGQTLQQQMILSRNELSKQADNQIVKVLKQKSGKISDSLQTLTVKNDQLNQNASKETELKNQLKQTKNIEKIIQHSAYKKEIKQKKLEQINNNITIKNKYCQNIRSNWKAKQNIIKFKDKLKNVQQNIKLKLNQINMSEIKFRQIGFYKNIQKQIKGILSQQGSQLQQYFQDRINSIKYNCSQQAAQDYREIAKEAEAHAKRQYQQYLQVLLQLWTKHYQQLCTSFEQVCRKHQKSVFYIDLQQYRKSRIYLCNQCIKETKKGNEQKHRMVVCKKHRQEIKFLLNRDSRQQLQTFLCSKCVADLPETDESKLNLISGCHYKPISQICTEQQCIQSENFIICQGCEDNKHGDHRKAIFTKQSLIDKFMIENGHSPCIFQEEFIDIKQRLKLHPIKKMIDSHVQQLWKVITFVEAFAVTDNKLVQKWINLFLKEGGKEYLYVLWAIQELKQRKYDEDKKRCFLQVFNDLIQVELEGTFKGISQELSALRRKIEKLVLIDEEEIDARLKQKYERVINIQDNDKIIEIPCRLEQINPIHLNRVQVIEINKGDDQNYRDKKESILKNERIGFYKYKVWKMFIQVNLPQILRRKIFNSIIQQNCLTANRVAYHLTRNLSQKDKRTIKIFQIELRTWITKYEQLKEKLNQCRILNFIKQRKLTHLKIIRIFIFNQYEQYYYLMPPFQLFEIMHNIKQLQQITINGVKIKQFQSFIKYFRAIKCNSNIQSVKQQYHTKDNLMGVQLLQQTVQKQMVDRYKWMKQFNPKHQIQLTINAQLCFTINKQNVLNDIQDYGSFLGYFKSVSDIKVIIQYEKNRDLKISDCEHIISQLIQQLGKIKRVSLIINRKHFPMNMFLVLFKKIFLLTNISKITFTWMNFSQNDSQIHNYIRDILQNNEITHLGIYHCKLFPEIPQINTLKSIRIQYSTFKKCPVIPTHIQTINITEYKYYNSLYTLLNQGQIKDFKQLQILHITSYYFNCNQLLQLGGQKIKSFKLQSIKCQQQILSKFFPKLMRLTQLQLTRINCSSQVLLLIPSSSLQSLKLYYNKQITNNGLQAIDIKWPYLQTITIWDCPKIDERIFGKCKFKSLMHLVFNKIMKNINDSTLQYIRKKGVQVQIYNF